MNGRVAVLDCELGNLFSVEQALRAVGADAFVTAEPAQLLSSQAAILPGVGAFGDAMRNLRERGLDAAIHEFARAGRPLLGICLGLQLLFSRGEEFGEHAGLGLLPGTVRRFPPSAPRAARLRVPQVGWNQIRPPGDRPAAWEGTPLSDLAPGEWMWFVHSYYVVPDDPGLCLTCTDYEGIVYCSGVQQGNVTGLQFHPEKSGAAGSRVLERWCAGWGGGRAGV